MRFFDALVRYEVTLWAAVDHALVAAGSVRLGQLHALRVLARCRGHARVQELSDEIGITVGAASKLVDRLERDGLATRQQNPADRRSSLIELTAAGEDAMTAALVVFESCVARAIGDLEVEGTLRTLQQLQVRLDDQLVVPA